MGSIDVITLALAKKYTDNATSGVSVFIENLADKEVSPAQSAHPVDDLIAYDNKLYKVIAPIAVGDTLTEGANIERTTIEAILGDHASKDAGFDNVTAQDIEDIASDVFGD